MSRVPDIDWEEDGYRGVSWMLGNDIYCETCGSSYNEVEFDPDFQGPNKWSFNYNVGCYDGDSLHYNEENREQRLIEIFSHLKMFPGWPQNQEMAIRMMIDECDRMREQK